MVEPETLQSREGKHCVIARCNSHGAVPASLAALSLGTQAGSVGFWRDPADNAPVALGRIFQSCQYLSVQEPSSGDAIAREQQAETCPGRNRDRGVSQVLGAAGKEENVLWACQVLPAVGDRHPWAAGLQVVMSQVSGLCVRPQGHH